MKAKTRKRYTPKGLKPTLSQRRRNRSGHGAGARITARRQREDERELLDAAIAAARRKYTSEQLAAMKTGDLRRTASQHGLAGAWRKNVDELRAYLAEVMV